MNDQQSKLFIVAAALLAWDLISRFPRQAAFAWIDERKMRRARNQADKINRDLAYHEREYRPRLDAIKRCANCEGRGSFCLYNRGDVRCSYDEAHRAYRTLMRGLPRQISTGEIPTEGGCCTWPSFVASPITRIFAEFVETERRRKE